MGLRASDQKERQSKNYIKGKFTSRTPIVLKNKNKGKLIQNDLRLFFSKLIPIPNVPSHLKGEIANTRGAAISQNLIIFPG